MLTDSIFDHDADLVQADLEAAGRAYGRAEKRMRVLRANGQLAEAAAACYHGSGYPTSSPAARNNKDPRAGTAGFRCTDCGSFFAVDGQRLHLSSLRGLTATVPCEIPTR